MAAPAPLTLTLHKAPWFRQLSFPTPDQQAWNSPNAGGAVIRVKLQAVRIASTW